MTEIIENRDGQKLPRVLLVEDEPISRDVIKLFLKHICNLDAASDGKEGVKLAEENQYSLILMDINLGRGMSGLQAAKQIKSHERYKDIPIVAVTAYAMPGDKEKFLAEGCTHYISKPFTKKTFVQFVENMLAEQSQKAISK